MGPLEVCGHAFESENGQPRLGDRCRCNWNCHEAVALHRECQEEHIAKGMEEGRSTGWTTGWKQGRGEEDIHFLCHENRTDSSFVLGG